MKSVFASLFFLLFVLSPAAQAAELQIGYGAIEKALLQQVFTRDGKKFFAGASEKDCNYALLADPRVSAEAERLRVTARFSTRAGLTIQGECVGPSETFEVWMTGVPAYRGGEIFLDQVRVGTPERPYADIARTFLEERLAGLLRYPLLAEIRRQAAEESARGGFQVTVPALDVSRMLVGGDGLDITLDFTVELQ